MPTVEDPNIQPSAAMTYHAFEPAVAQRWLHALAQHETSPPSSEQQAVLAAVVNRCIVEHAEEAKDGRHSEPLRCILHGVPGAGKSQTLKWLQDFFLTACGWQADVRFAYLAPQNTQAALIDGQTLHHFADI